MCNKEHYLAHCTKYQQNSTKQRLDLVSIKKLCFNCLGSHQVSSCQSVKRCIKGSKRHHSSLHRVPTAINRKPPTEFNNAPLISSVETISTPRETFKNVHHAKSETSGINAVVLLATAQVQVLNQFGEARPARVLLDRSGLGNIISH